LCAWRDSNP